MVHQLGLPFGRVRWGSLAGWAAAESDARARWDLPAAAWAFAAGATFAVDQVPPVAAQAIATWAAIAVLERGVPGTEAQRATAVQLVAAFAGWVEEHFAMRHNPPAAPAR